ncbi:NACHT domain-containing protein [Fusarium keratoplasticum]|nr:NACHT domain-containing protein [Fusarium keratoplasticum]
MNQLPQPEGLKAVPSQDITVVIFCALAIEITAVKFTLDERLISHPVIAGVDSFNYSYGRIRDHNVVLARGTQMGPVNAAACAATVIQQFPNIRFALMIGIGGGIPSQTQDIRLGDIAVGIPGGSHPGVLQYDFGKYEQDGSFILKGCLNKPPSILINACHRLEEYEEEMGWRPHYITLTAIGKNHERYKRPAKDDVLFKDEFHHVNASGDCSECEALGKERVVFRKRRDEIDQSLVHLGLILSGGGVVKNPEDRRRLCRGNEDAICFEMEAAGIVDQIPCLVIRGICDYADTHKNDDWHRYAAAAAAAYGKAVLTEITGQEVNAAMSVQDLMQTLKSVEGKIGEVGEHVDSLREGIKQQEVLDWLGQEGWRHPQDNYFARCEPGTGRWFLDSPQFNEWLTGAETTLFCQGLPGAGKTVMASLAIDHLRRTSHEKTFVIFMYCDIGKREQQKVVHVLASLLRQLIEASPSMPECVLRLYSKNKGRQLGSVSAQEFTDALIESTLLFSRVYVVIDALDECEEVSNLLPEIFRMQQEVKVNVFVTSRPDKRIEAMFGQYLSLEIRASDEDVGRYLEKRIARHRVIKDESGEYAAATKTALRETVKERIRQVSDGIFLLARFHMDSVLEMTSPNRMRGSIEMLPQGPAAYREIYLKTAKRIENQPEEYRTLAKKTLIWLVCAMRPITVSELREALAIKINTSRLDHDDFSSTESIVEACKGLVAIGKDGVMQLLHHTAREYLDSNFGWLEGSSIRELTVTGGKARSLSVEAVEAVERPRATAQHDITLKLITYISFDTFETGPCTGYHHYREREKLNRLYRYASCHWGDHLKSCGPHVSDIVDLGAGSLLTRLFGSKKKSGSLIQAYFNGDSPSSKLAEGNGDYLEGFTSLHLAASCGVEPLVTAILKNHQVNAKDSLGRAPLSYAAEKGHVEVVIRLLQAGAHIETSDQEAQTPLAYAAQWGQKEVVRCLLEENADTERRNLERKTSLMLAVMGGHHVVADLLIEGGANIEARDSRYMTLLSWAAENGRANAVDYLLQKNARTDTRDLRYRTPLIQAAEGGHIDAARLLFNRGVDIGARDSRKYTALLAAANKGHTNLVEGLRSWERHQGREGNTSSERG